MKVDKNNVIQLLRDSHVFDINTYLTPEGNPNGQAAHWYSRTLDEHLYDGVELLVYRESIGIENGLSHYETSDQLSLSFNFKKKILQLWYDNYDNDGGEEIEYDEDGIAIGVDFRISTKLFSTEEEYFQLCTVQEVPITYEEMQFLDKFFKDVISLYITDYVNFIES